MRYRGNTGWNQHDSRKYNFSLVPAAYFEKCTCRHTCKYIWTNKQKENSTLTSRFKLLPCTSLRKHLSKNMSLWDDLDAKRACDIPELNILLEQNTTEASQDKHSSDCQVQVTTGKDTERKFSRVSTAKAISLYIYTLTQFELKQWIVNFGSGMWVFSCGTIAECNWSQAGKILSTFQGRRIPAKMHIFVP